MSEESDEPSDDDRDGETDDDAADEVFGMAYGGRRSREPNPEELFTRSGERGTTLQDISRADLREHYGPLRTLFKRNEDRYTAFQRQLTQAWIPRTYDQYLTRVLARALGIGAAVVVAGLLAAVGLLAAGRTGTAPETLPVVGLAPATAATVVALGGVVAGVGIGVAYWAWWRVVWLRNRIARRRREINYNLPYAVTFMYALTRAGVSFDRTIARLADATDTYGAVAQEFDRVVRDVEMFGNNLYAGLENLQSVTPSEELRLLVDDVTTVLETGGDLAAFLRDEVETQLETAVAEQERFVERLELLSEVFVVGFVAAPLFVLVVLIVINFLGAPTLPAIGAIVYVAIPLALAGFLVLVDSFSQPFATRAPSFDARRGSPSPPEQSDDDPQWRGAYQRNRARSGLRERLREEVLTVREQPWRALLFSVPIAVAFLALELVFRTPFSQAALLADPVEVTTELVVVPVVVALTPVALVYEYERRKRLTLERRFPNLLELLATSNRRGLSLLQTLNIVTETTSGRLGEELRQLRNDVEWNADLPAAFEAFGRRLPSASAGRAVNLVAEGARATSDLHVVLEVAATDTAERVRLERERRQTLQTYLVIVIVGFLVYLLVVLLLAANFLDPIEAASAEAPATGGPVSLADIPVDELRVVLFHSALIQGFGSGVLAGKLAENSVYSGLKYGIGLTVLAVVAFTVV